MLLDNNSLPLSDEELEEFLDGLGVTSQTPSQNKSYDAHSLSSLLKTIDVLTQKNIPSYQEEVFVFEPLPEFPSYFPSLIYDGSDVWNEPKKKKRQWPKLIFLYGGLFLIGWWTGYTKQVPSQSLTPIYEQIELVTKQIDQLGNKIEMLQAPLLPIELDPFPWLPREEEVIEPLEPPQLDRQLA
ncbi:MAG: hypothetical protein KDK55_05090 [Chlamydiia bacterium]|nr:hypothetical protein [Chlamydiia bacterium]